MSSANRRECKIALYLHISKFAFAPVYRAKPVSEMERSGIKRHSVEAESGIERHSVETWSGIGRHSVEAESGYERPSLKAEQSMGGPRLNPPEQLMSPWQKPAAQAISHRFAKQCQATKNLQDIHRKGACNMDKVITISENSEAEAVNWE